MACTARKGERAWVPLLTAVAPSAWTAPSSVTRPAHAADAPPLAHCADLGSLSGFLPPLVKRLVEEDSVAEFLVPLLNKLEQEMRQTSLVGDFTSLYNALITLVQQKPVGAVLGQDVRFLPKTATNGALLESRARLAAFFRLSCFPNEAKLSLEIFPDLTQGHVVENGFTSLRMSLQMLHRAMTVQPHCRHRLPLLLLRTLRCRAPRPSPARCRLEGLRARPAPWPPATPPGCARRQPTRARRPSRRRWRRTSSRTRT